MSQSRFGPMRMTGIIVITAVLGSLLLISSPAFAADRGDLSRTIKQVLKDRVPAGKVPPMWATVSEDAVSSLLYSASTDAGTPVGRTAALLDLTARNGESNNSTFALDEALNIAGVPHIITTNVASASAYRIIYTSSSISSSTLKNSERNTLKAYVRDGGVLVSTNMNDSNLFQVFGVSGSVRTNTRHRMTWKVNTGDKALHYFDDPLERTISFGRLTSSQVIYTRGYSLNGAQELGEHDDGSAGVTREQYGDGTAYALGFSYTDVVLRNMINTDFNAQRIYSNGFEPTTDTIILFLRGIYEDHVPYAVWKHTSVGDSRASVMITHDVDSKTSMEMMNGFASLEADHGVVGTYNVTTHYISDKQASNFYDPYIAMLQSLLYQGGVIDSHSVGHFPDFDKETIFPVGLPGNDRFNYTPYYNGTETIGGTLYGELEVSKNLLVGDIGANVRSFRSGYLLNHDNQIGVLDALGYEFDSSMSANDILIDFPYRAKAKRAFSGAVTDIYEIPMTISDRGLDGTNYPSKVDNWVTVTEQNAGNFAPTVLLIHPNRSYKVTAQEDYLNRTAPDIKFVDLDSFGSFWQARADLQYETELIRTDLIITILDGQPFPPSEDVSLFLQDGAALSSITVEREDGTPVLFSQSAFGPSDLILHGFS